MDGVKAWLERVPSGRFAALGAGGVLMPLVATLIATGAGDGILVALAGLVAVAWGWGHRHRQQVAQLPLEIGPVALTGIVDGVPVYRFRVRLGRGRLICNPNVHISYKGADGRDVTLTPILPVRSVVGPLTVTASDPEDACSGPGAFTLRIQVHEGERDWEAQGTWETATIKPGRFAPGFTRVGGRVRWDHEDWAAPASAQKEITPPADSPTP